MRGRYRSYRYVILSWCRHDVQIIEVIREHRFYEKRFVVETRPAGERELTDRQNVCPSTNPCPYLDPRPLGLYILSWC